MEGQGPKSKAKAKSKAEVSAVAATTNSTAPVAATGSTDSPPPAYAGDLSCAIIDELSVEEVAALLAGGQSTNCLDSGTSSHLFKD